MTREETETERERRRGGFRERMWRDECAQCLLAAGWGVGGVGGVSTAALTSDEAVSLTNTHCLNRKDGWENGKVRAVGPAALHRKYRIAADLSLTHTHTHTHTHTQILYTHANTA